jgi:hypothetical protein
MSIVASKKAWSLLGIGSTKKLVLLGLADHADAEGGSCFPYQKTLAAMTNLSVRSVRKALAELEAAGIIERCSRRSSKGRATSDSYRLKYLPDAKDSAVPGPTDRARRPEEQSAASQQAPDAGGPRIHPAPYAEPAGNPSRSERHEFPLGETLSSIGSNNELSLDPKESAPTRPVLGSIEVFTPEKSSRPNPKTSWPENLQLTPEMRMFAQQFGVDADVEFEAWREYCETHGPKYCNWYAAWRLRIRLTRKFGAAPSPSTRLSEQEDRDGPNLTLSAQRLVKKINELGEEERGEQQHEQAASGGSSIQSYINLDETAFRRKPAT